MKGNHVASFLTDMISNEMRNKFEYNLILVVENELSLWYISSLFAMFNFLFLLQFLADFIQTCLHSFKLFKALSDFKSSF